MHRRIAHIRFEGDNGAEDMPQQLQSGSDAPQVARVIAAVDSFTTKALHLQDQQFPRHSIPLLARILRQAFTSTILAFRVEAAHAAPRSAGQ
jgi:hypothetical protein